MSAHNLIKYTLNGYMADISTAGQIYIPITEEFAGQVVEIRSAINGAIGTSDATLTPKVNGTAMTNGAITVATASSAAGDVDVSYPTSNNAVRVGDAIEIETDGASTNTVEVFFTITVRR